MCRSAILQTVNRCSFRGSVWGLAALVCVLCPGLAAGLEPPRAVGQPVAATELSAGIDARRIERHIRYLASEELQGRSGPGARLAARYIRRQFQELGLRPLFGNRFLQDIPAPESRPEEVRLRGENVGALLPGSDPELKRELIIISAHYDHLGTLNGRVFPGADDNASGVAMMIEVARQFARGPRPRRSLAFVGFDLEERMLWGSRWFAAHAPWPMERVALFITADMIGRSLGDLAMPTVFCLGSEHAPLLQSTLDRVPRPGSLEVARLGIDLVGTRSDYGPFRDRKVPFLFFSTGEHPDYHSVNDMPDRVQFEKVALVSTYIRDIVRDVASAERRPAWTDEVQPSIEEARAVHRITDLLMQNSNQTYSPAQELVISFVNVRTRQIVERGRMTADERSWLTRMSQLLLLSVF